MGGNSSAGNKHFILHLSSVWTLYEIIYPCSENFQLLCACVHPYFSPPCHSIMISCPEWSYNMNFQPKIKFRVRSSLLSLPHIPSPTFGKQNFRTQTLPSLVAFISFIFFIFNFFFCMSDISGLHLKNQGFLGA